MSYDYFGSMRVFQDQLTAKGIPVEELDMNDYAGLTAKQLQGIVDNAEMFRHKPKQPAAVVYETYREALETMRPVLDRYGFAVPVDRRSVEESVPVYSNLTDTFTGKKVAIGFEVNYGTVDDAYSRFLRDLKRFINICCADEHIKEQKRKRSVTCNRKIGCKSCMYQVPPATYNRLKGMFYELTCFLQEKQSHDKYDRRTAKNRRKMHRLP